MDEKTASTGNKASNRVPLGMSSFGLKEQQQFGQSIRLAMACIEGTEAPDSTKAMPSDEATIRRRLQTLSKEMTSQQADLLELLVRFDEMKGWESSGAKHCAAWVNLELGISLSMGWEYLRVGRKLRSLPTTTALFRAGKIQWSKIRVIVNVADADNEKTLCHAALDASVSEVVRLCNEYKWQEDDDGEGENARARKQWESRSLTWNETSIGSTLIQLNLPPEIAQAFLNGIEHSLSQLDYPEDDSGNSISQRRADAAVLMAESSLQAAGREIATADRYQVIVSVDATELSNYDKEQGSTLKETPSKRATVKGAGPIARETARRIACDCSVTTNTTTHGEPTDIGRKSRIWPAAMARAIKERDQHCQFNGCTQTRNLHVHHIVHWADGGSTSVENGVSLCQGCHTKVHEGGYTVQRIDCDKQRIHEQFAQQQHADDISMFSFEKDLRDDRASFDMIRKLSPTRYRFRVMDAEGRDIRAVNCITEGIQAVTHASTSACASSVINSSYSTTKIDAAQKSQNSSSHSPRGECAESETTVNHYGEYDGTSSDISNIAEHPAVYHLNVSAQYVQHHSPISCCFLSRRNTTLSRQCNYSRAQRNGRAAKYAHAS